jgi:8-amino-7-oxononanoate synthase
MDGAAESSGGASGPLGPLGPLARLRSAAAARDASGLRRTLHPRSPDHDGLLDLASNDYLGLSRSPRLVEGAVQATRAWGTGATGSRLVSGTTTLHAELETALARFADAPAALVFSSGYLANLSAVTALATALGRGPRGAAGRGDGARSLPGTDGPAGPSVLVVSDEANHASLIDACRLSRARLAVTAHGDAAAVAAALATRGEETALVVTDAVFSVAGDLAPLEGLHRAARAHGALLIVDEAHALGVVGDGGRGGVHAAGLSAQPDVVRTVTLSKSLGTQGGAVLGAAVVIETLVDTGRSFIFDTGLAPACAGAALAALEVLTAAPWLARRTRERARQLADIAVGLGFETTRPDAAVVSLTLGPPAAAVAARRLCAEHGVQVACFRPPSVSEGRSCLRLAARPDLTDADLETVGRALAAVRAHAPHAAAPQEGGDRP